MDDDGTEVNYPSWETILSVQQVSSLSQEFAIVAVIIISNQRDMESGGVGQQFIGPIINIQRYAGMDYIIIKLNASHRNTQKR